MRTSEPAPRWAVRAAHVVPLVVLPSAVWRLTLIGGVIGPEGAMGAAEWSYILLLSAVSEGLALLTLGLVRPWGERVPSWVPVAGGRRIPPRAVVGAAFTGVALLTAVAVYSALNAYVFHLHFEPQIGDDHGTSLDTTGPTWWLAVCYLPLLAWAPLLTAITLDFRRRHRLEFQSGDLLLVRDAC